MSEPYAHIRNEIRRLSPWHHDVTIAPGLHTGDPVLNVHRDPALGDVSLVNPSALLQYVFPQLFPDGLAGRSFLDCGCNAGGYVFAAKDLGAGRAYGFDARAHWIKQATFLAHVFNSGDVEFACHPLSALPARDLAPCDVTMFSGLLYHLPDPVGGLRIAADLTRELLLVSTATRPGPVAGLVLNHESDHHLMSGIDHLAWMPTGPDVVQAILRWCGFPHTRIAFDQAEPGGRRVLLLAARTADTLARFREPAPADDGPARRPKSAIARLLGV